VGRRVGEMEGFELGAAEGCFVGVKDGRPVGENVAPSRVGERVTGLEVGNLVGKAEGA